ncbi:MAG TPA: hypothetical protein VFA43_12850 [Gemmatimonadaceae bacterium]|nr:hypothetical protein [Gemmatimonadaceae bacterium]
MSRDPLGRDIVTDQVLVTGVLGVPVRFESNSYPVIALAAETFGRGEAAKSWRRKPMVVRIVVHDEPAAPSTVRVWSPDPSRLIMHGADRVAVADPLRRQAVAYVSCSLLARRMEFKQTVLEALTYAIVDHYDRHPLHAAAVAKDGAVVLLLGASGSGKSTLAYAAHLAGLTIMSDDTVWVQLRPRTTIWGPATSDRRISLLPDARETFPSLADQDPVRLPSGKCKISISLGGEPVQPTARATVCVLKRTTHDTALTRARPETVAAALAREPEPGFDRFPTRHAACVRALAGSGGWELAVSNDPSSAVPHLVAMLDAAQRVS